MTQLRLLSLAETLTGVGYWTLRLSDQQAYWSDEVYRILGIKPGPFTPTVSDVVDFFHPDDRSMIADQFNRVLKDGGNFEFEGRLIRPDGDARTVMARGVRETAPDGTPLGMIGVVQDITEQRKAEAAQREQAERLSRFIERLPAGAVHVRDGALTMNAELERITGYSRGELPTLHAWFAKLYGDETGQRPAKYEQARQEGFKSIVQGVIRRRDGETRVLELRACDDPSGEIWIVHDVTDREAIQAELVAAKERAEVAARAKSEFLANMSHELRTPLTAIIGFAGLLADQNAMAQVERHWVSRIDDAGKALLAIVNDVLDFSKLETDSIELEQEAFDPRRLVADTLALLEEQAMNKGVGLRAEISDDAPAGLMGDTGRLRQILINLVSNAVKFTVQGEVRVTVAREDRWRPEAGRSTPGVGFKVIDSGIGIPEEAQGQIFQRFVQADGSISRRFGGTGLGLAISARLVELMGGEIGVISQPGEGSTFWFWAPLPEADCAAPAVPIEADLDLGALRVLLVEDAEANQELISTLLRAVGVQVSIAGNGAEAVEAVKTAAYDLILMDVQMPVMGGVEATQIIRGLGGQLTHTPIIALSANVLPEQVATYQRAGMNAHLGKPINPRELLATIAQWAEAGDAAREDGAAARDAS